MSDNRNSIMTAEKDLKMLLKKLPPLGDLKNDELNLLVYKLRIKYNVPLMKGTDKITISNLCERNLK